MPGSEASGGSISQDGDVWIVEMRDELIDRTLSERLERSLSSMAKREDCRSVVVDLASVKFLSSAALAAFVIARNLLLRKGGSIRLCNATPAVAEVFWVTQLNRLLPIDDDRASSLSRIRDSGSAD